MAKKNYLEFGTMLISQTDVDPSIKGEVLISNVGNLARKITKLVINEAEVEIDRSVVNTLADALKSTQLFEAHGSKIDCAIFAGILCGGQYTAPKHNPSGLWAITTSVRHAGMYAVANEADTDYKTMRPTLLGTVWQSGKFKGQLKPRHAAVKLPTTQELWIQKLGLFNVALTTLSDSAALYDASHFAAIETLHIEQEAKQVLRYETAVPSPEPHFSFSVSSWPIK